jgi:hypothetical protein
MHHHHPSIGIGRRCSTDRNSDRCSRSKGWRRIGKGFASRLKRASSRTNILLVSDTLKRVEGTYVCHSTTQTGHNSWQNRLHGSYLHSDYLTIVRSLGRLLVWSPANNQDILEVAQYYPPHPSGRHWIVLAILRIAVQYFQRRVDRRRERTIVHRHSSLVRMNTSGETTPGVPNGGSLTVP